MFFTDNGTPTTRMPVACDDAPHPGVRDAPPIELWDAWLFAAADAGLMLHAWLGASAGDKWWTHAGYRSALEREEHAARVLDDRLTATAALLSAQ